MRWREMGRKRMRVAATLGTKKKKPCKLVVTLGLDFFFSST
jgi:hypothetical protein